MKRTYLTKICEDDIYDATVVNFGSDLASVCSVTVVFFVRS